MAIKLESMPSRGNWKSKVSSNVVRTKIYQGKKHTYIFWTARCPIECGQRIGRDCEKYGMSQQDILDRRPTISWYVDTLKRLGVDKGTLNNCLNQKSKAAQDWIAQVIDAAQSEVDYDLRQTWLV